MLQSVDWLCAFNSGTPFGEWMLWQVMQLRLRCSCWLPSHRACVARLWHDVHVALTSDGEMAVNLRMSVGSPLSACAFPGPWQFSHPMVRRRRPLVERLPVRRALVGLVLVTAEARGLADISGAGLSGCTLGGREGDPKGWLCGA